MTGRTDARLIGLSLYTVLFGMLLTLANGVWTPLRDRLQLKLGTDAPIWAILPECMCPSIARRRMEMVAMT